MKSEELWTLLLDALEEEGRTLADLLGPISEFTHVHPGPTRYYGKDGELVGTAKEASSFRQGVATVHFKFMGGRLLTFTLPSPEIDLPG